MTPLRKLTFAVLFTIALRAQVVVPETPAGRVFSAWLNAINSGDRGAVRQFIDHSMSWGKVDEVLSMREGSGGFDVKKVEKSSATQIVVLV